MIPCDYCSYQARDIYNLKRHHRMKHMVEKTAELPVDLHAEKTETLEYMSTESSPAMHTNSSSPLTPLLDMKAVESINHRWMGRLKTLLELIDGDSMGYTMRGNGIADHILDNIVKVP